MFSPAKNQMEDLDGYIYIDDLKFQFSIEKSPYVKNCNDLYSCKHPISFQKAILKQASVVFSSLALLFRLSLFKSTFNSSSSNVKFMSYSFQSTKTNP